MPSWLTTRALFIGMVMFCKRKKPSETKFNILDAADFLSTQNLWKKCKPSRKVVTICIIRTPFYSNQRHLDHLIHANIATLRRARWQTVMMGIQRCQSLVEQTVKIILKTAQLVVVFFVTFRLCVAVASILNMQPIAPPIILMPSRNAAVLLFFNIRLPRHWKRSCCCCLCLVKWLWLYFLVISFLLWCRRIRWCLRDRQTACQVRKQFVKLANNLWKMISKIRIANSRRKTRIWMPINAQHDIAMSSLTNRCAIHKELLTSIPLSESEKEFPGLGHLSSVRPTGCVLDDVQSSDVVGRVLGLQILFLAHLLFSI